MITGGGRRLAPLWIALAAYALSTIVLSIGLALTVLRVVNVPSSAMERTVPRGSSLLVDHLHHDPHDGDIVEFRGRSWGAPGSFIKRVIATGGETVACCTLGSVTVDSRPVDEPYVFQDDSQGFGPVTVPPHRLWVMGDNRSQSADSRAHVSTTSHGTISVADVIGTAHGPYSYGGAHWRIRRLAAVLALPIALAVGLLSTALVRRRNRAAQAV